MTRGYFSAPYGALAAIAVSALINASPAAAQSDAVRASTTVIVTAQKEPYDLSKLPLSVTAVAQPILQAEGIAAVADTAAYAPNTFFSEFTARKLSFPRFRGVSSGPGSPGVTTNIDGVPMLHTNAANPELVDVDQIELVRGGQSALFGRNALGGIINLATARPSLSKWTGSVSVPIGNYSAVDTRGTISGPIGSSAAISFSAGRNARDGFTTNDVTGNDLDYRNNLFAKGQLLWTPAANWETRLIVSGEHARDGDYALGALTAIRQDPFHVQHDFEGHTDRDIVSATFLTRREGSSISLSTITGIVSWDTKDETDLDYYPLPLATRSNAEEATQFTQEVRLASAAAAPIRLSDRATMRWQAGVFFFTQGYDQLAVNTYAPGVVSQFLPFTIAETSPQAALDDLGIGIYGQSTIVLGDRIDVGFGARFDNEQKDAVLDTFYTPAIGAPPNHVDGDKSFSNVSPQASVAFRLTPNRMLYGSFGTGYKAGGFNPVSPSANQAYDEEHTWQLEGGVKTTWAEGRVQASAALFYIDWDDLQVNVPHPQIPLSFYLANVAGATSAGVELEISGRAAEGLDLFGMFGYTNGRFSDGSFSGGINVSDNRLPSTPDYTATFGANYRHAMSNNYTLFGRGEVELVGSYEYDDANTTAQDAYSLINLRLGIERGPISVDGWIRNAANTEYVPLAFPYPGIGFLGEMGRPRTYGIRLGLRF